MDLLKDKRLAIFIKYNPEGNIAGYFGRNVFRPTERKLNPQYGRVPPEFTWCPAGAVPKVPTTSPSTMPNVRAAATKAVSLVKLFLGAFILVSSIL